MDIDFSAWLVVVKDFQALSAGILALIAAIITSVCIFVTGRYSAKATLEAAVHQGEDGVKAIKQKIDNDNAAALRQNKRDLYLERAHLAGAFIGELRGIITLVCNREIVESYRENAEEIRKLGNRSSGGFIKFPIQEDYFTVYRSSCNRIGVFSGDLPKDIATFYTLASGAVDFLKAISAGFYDNDGNENKISTCTHIMQDFEALTERGNKLVKLLEAERDNTLNQANDL